MHRFNWSTAEAPPITEYDSTCASSVELAAGSGAAHVYCVRIEPGGRIGAHPAGFGQLFIVTEGDGWAAGADGHRIALRAGQGVYFARGEVHSKGSDSGMTALMVQVSDLDLHIAATPR